MCLIPMGDAGRGWSLRTSVRPRSLIGTFPLTVDVGGVPDLSHDQLPTEAAPWPVVFLSVSASAAPAARARGGRCLLLSGPWTPRLQRPNSAAVRVGAWGSTLCSTAQHPRSLLLADAASLSLSSPLSFWLFSFLRTNDRHSQRRHSRFVSLVAPWPRVESAEA